MADVEKKILEKLRRLYEALRENEAKSYAIVEEMGALLNGADGIGDKLKQLEAKFNTLWSARYGIDSHGYIWNYVRDRPQMKRLLKTLTVDDIGRRMENYMRDDDKYLTAARHTFGLFVSQVNRYADYQDIGASHLEAPADCKHSPRCASEQAHTKKRTAEMRS